MTDKEAMKLALEALIAATPVKAKDPQMQADAIVALKEALAQPEQEPAAWRETHGKVIKALAGIVNVHTPDKLFDLDAIPRDPVMGLVQQIKGALDKYKPPPQRTWVGLTDEDWDEIFGNSLTIGAAIKNTEAKLKEKNQ